MDSRNLTEEQAQRLTDQVRRHLQYMNRLTKRMQTRGFPPHDELMLLAQRARDATFDLHAACLRAGVKHGVGREAIE